MIVNEENTLLFVCVCALWVGKMNEGCAYSLKQTTLCLLSISSLTCHPTCVCPFVLVRGYTVWLSDHGVLFMT